MIISPALAQAAAPAGPSIIDLLFPLVFVVFIIYFMVLRPQQKRQQEHTAMVDGIRRGDTVVTQGGLIGRVIKSNDDDVEVEIAENTRVKVVKTMILSVQGKGEDTKKS